jgi:Ca2+-dependent lipid-binding protein
MLNNPDPYVEFCLENDNFGPFDKSYGKQTSSVKKGTCNPNYDDETFVFSDVRKLDNLVLTLKVYDSDMGRDDHMGEKKLNLERSLTPGVEKDFVEELDKDRKGMFQRDAKIYLKIKYDE